MMAENSGLKLIGIGIGAPNANFNKGTIELAPNLRWKGIIPLVRMTEEATGLRTRITNDANAAALGEMIFGAAKGVKDFIILTPGTGLGSGFVVDGEVVYGHTGFAGELGHMIVVEEAGCADAGAAAVLKHMHQPQGWSVLLCHCSATAVMIARCGSSGAVRSPHGGSLKPRRPAISSLRKLSTRPPG